MGYAIFNLSFLEDEKYFQKYDLHIFLITFLTIKCPFLSQSRKKQMVAI